ncbi:MAG: hypothetical protein JO104_11910 [Candidatus Eremiobacteraeota bacterium]|nr:hypothetical protein [Candidatus Eremiobacteraeota bacterium]
MHVRPVSLTFLLVAATAGIVACRGGSTAGMSPLPSAFAQPEHTTPIKHIVIAIQENRSFDNLFATFPHADGATTGKAAAMPPAIKAHCSKPITRPTTVPLAKVSLLGDRRDIDHVYTAFEFERDGGAMDGFDLSRFDAGGQGGPTCRYVYQYVDPTEIQPYWDIAKEYVLADHTFQTQGSGSFTAHQDLIAGGTAISPNEALIDNPTGMPWGCDANRAVRTAVIKRGSNQIYRDGGPFPCLSYMTMRDLLDAKHVSWKFYATPVRKWNGRRNGDTAGMWSAFDAIKAVREGREWGTNVDQGNLHFFSDVTHHQLPAVSWITPDFVNSDHPREPSDTGPSWIAAIVNAVGKSSYWDSTAIVVVWDDWGGFYDHMPPPPHRQSWEGGPGFRVPMLIVAPYVNPHVDHTVYEFGSILRFAEETFGLGSLGNNDAHSTSIGDAFDFAMGPRKFAPIGSKYSTEFFLHQPPSGVEPDTE